MAPILSFTAEEIHALLTGDADDSVFFHTWHELPGQDAEAPLLDRWTRLRVVRSRVQKHLEELRVAGAIGSSLQAEVTLHAQPDSYADLAALGDDLRFVLIVSAASVLPAAEDRIVAVASPHAKCERCWHYRDDVGKSAEHPALCGRCVSNLFGEGEARQHA